MLENVIRQKLEEALTPSKLIVVNESSQHDGHGQSPDTGHSHFYIEIESPKFIGLSKVQQHQLVYNLLQEEMKSAIHALRLTTRA